mmetsp:Transcript_4101/g.9103  ORF Transcript_4101/g.9103 Transcript_4101/m.9103 type:complete len:98 (+) Transcript_4101:133-426(+)
MSHDEIELGLQILSDRKSTQRSIRQFHARPKNIQLPSTLTHLYKSNCPKSLLFHVCCCWLNTCWFGYFDVFISASRTLQNIFTLDCPPTTSLGRHSA